MRAQNETAERIADPTRKRLVPSHEDSLVVARRVAAAADDLKANDILILDIRGSGYADYLVLASGTSDRHVSAIAESIETQLKQSGHSAIGSEGLREGQWALIDFCDVVAHVFHEYSRGLYAIEDLWKNAPRVSIT